MEKKLPIRAVIAFSLGVLVALSVLITYCLREFVPQFGALDYKTLEKLSEIEQLLEQDYYYEIDEDTLSEAVVEGYVEGVGDKYSGYYPVELASKEADKLAGESHGIGITALNTTKGIYVWRIYSGSPAQKAGIKMGDIIVKVNNQDVLEIGYEKSIESIAGKVGKKNKLQILRGKETLEFEVECGACDIQSVFAYESSDKKFGRIEVLSFNNKTHLQFKAALNYFQKSEVSGIVVDLRANRGGTINSAIEMLDYLLPECDSVYARYNDGKITAIGKSDAECVDIPMVVLVSEKTASASEIFACSLREHKRAVLMGEKTYGKSAIQRSYNLKDGSRVKFTVGEYIPENGESYNGIGLEPDIKVEPEYSESEFYFLTEETDNLLKEAYEYLGQLS